VVRITDAPFDAEAVLITFSAVSARDSSGNFDRISFVSGSPSRTCDMKRLYGGKQDTLAQDSLPAGHYTALRFTISSGTLFFENPAVLPSCDTTIGAPRGSKEAMSIPAPEVTVDVQFDISAGGTTTLVADLAGPRSISGRPGAFVLHPVIHIDSVQGP
jgi:hypothetical protein